MIFTDVRLQNYRSYKDASFDLGGGVTIIIGPNAAGKSNLIEALLVIANGVNYRGRNGLINKNKDWARIDVHTTQSSLRSLKLQLETEEAKPKKEFEIDGKLYKRLPFAQKQPVVLFEPNDLFLLHGEPKNRREYIDNLTAGLQPEYTSILSRYKRVLAQRNSLLKSANPGKDQLFVWNVRLSELAEKIVKQRTDTIKKIHQKLNAIYSEIAKTKSKTSISYLSNISRDNYSAVMLKKLEDNLNLDIARGFTGTGPHRDDLEVFLGETLAYVQASRGEIRTLLLALKIIELELLEENNGSQPLLLLDDVFSELDGARRKALTQFLQKYQTIITTTDADIVLKNFSQNCQIIPL